MKYLRLQKQILNQTRDQQIRNSILKIWKRSLNERKQAYWNFLKFKNINQIYETWLEKSDPILPMKFRIIEIQGEYEEDKIIRKENSIRSFEAEVKILKNKIQRAEGKFTTIDREIFELLSQKADEDIHSKLVEMWKNECEKEEQKSYMIWSKKETWYREYEGKYGSSIFVTRSFPKTKNNTPARNASPRRTYSEVVRSNPHKSQNNGEIRWNQGKSVYRYKPRNGNRFKTNDNTNNRHSRRKNVQSSFLGLYRADREGGGLMRHRQEHKTRPNEEQETRVKEVF